MIGNNKRLVQVDYLKKVIHGLEHQAMLPQGEHYLDLATGVKLKQVPKVDVPRKVIAFSCGGGSFFEYEQVRALNDEKCKAAGRSGSGAKALGDDASMNGGGAFFD